MGWDALSARYSATTLETSLPLYLPDCTQMSLAPIAPAHLHCTAADAVCQFYV